MKINPNILGLTLDSKITYNKHMNNKSTQNITDTQNTHINNIGKTKGSNTPHIKGHNKTHTLVRFHYIVTSSIRPVKEPLQLHASYIRQKSHLTHPLFDNKLHNNTTSNMQTHETNKFQLHHNDQLKSQHHK